MSTLAADPYYFNNSRHFNKAEFIDKDVGYLKAFFGKNETEIFDASKSYIGREEQLFNIVSAVKFWDNGIKVQLTDKSTNLSTLVSIFAIEAIASGLLNGKEDRFRSFLLDYLSNEEKIELVSGYTFGMPYKIGEGSLRKKHLCYRAATLTDHGRMYRNRFCSSGPNPICTCRDWLNTADGSKINKYLNMFATYIYQMRSSVVHDARFVQFTSMPWHDEDLGNVIPTTADAFSDNRKKTFTSYDTDITVHRWHEIMKSAAWRCFENGSKLKPHHKVKMLKRL